jgi:hypothetical protein
MLSGPGGKAPRANAGVPPVRWHAKGFSKVYPGEFCLPGTRLPRDNRLAPGTAEPSPGPVPLLQQPASRCADVGPGDGILGEAPRPARP